MIRTITVTLLLFILLFDTKAQNYNKKDIMHPIVTLFEAMAENDSSKASSVLEENAQLIRISQQDSATFNTQVSSASVLLTAFAKEKDQVWTEPFWNEIIKVDIGFATVWVDYAFFVDSTFSHCGIDAFQLILKSDGWKIFSITDTKRETDCDIPEIISARY